MVCSGRNASITCSKDFGLFTDSDTGILVSITCCTYESTIQYLSIRTSFYAHYGGVCIEVAAMLENEVQILIRGTIVRLVRLMCRV